MLGGNDEAKTQAPETASITIDSIMATVASQKQVSPEVPTSEVPKFEEGETISAEAKLFLEHIPELGFMLEREIRLPGLSTAPQAKKRDSIGMAFGDL